MSECSAKPGPVAPARGQLFHHGRRMQPVAAAAAILVGNGRTEKASLARRPPDRPRHNLVLLPLRVVRRDLTLDEAAHLIAIKLMLLGKQRTMQHDLILALAASRSFRAAFPSGEASLARARRSRRDS